MKLDDIRRDYLKGGLNREDLAESPFKQFEHWMQQAIDAELTADPTAMVLATVDGSGRPSQRVVLLKGMDESGFLFFTNYDSQKGHDIDRNPQVSLHFGWLPIERQVIIQGEAEKLSFEESDRYFQSRPRASQIGAWTSHQSHPVESRSRLDEAFKATEERFADGPVPTPDFWGGYRVKPSQIEFWQGRASRLHDRFVYRLEQGRWRIERLQP